MKFRRVDYPVTINQLFIFLTCVAILSLFFSFSAELLLCYEPCKLCKFQRISHLTVAVFALLGVFFQAKKIISWLLIALSIAGLSIACYHLASQLGFVSDPCVVSTPNNIEDLKFMLFSTSIPCSSIQVSIIGIPLSGWNAFLFSLYFVIATHIIKSIQCCTQCSSSIIKLK